MKVEFLEKVKIGRNAFEAGDVSSALDDALCALCVAQGWAKDVETGKTGERKEGAHKLEVQDLEQKLG